jgi:hypothetical protein
MLFESRMEALQQYQQFMQRLDANPRQYHVHDFIAGTAAALRAMFPQVHIFVSFSSIAKWGV